VKENSNSNNENNKSALKTTAQKAHPTPQRICHHHRQIA
jgi:hypothetical protein